jgi:hypothetical protein
LVMWRQALLNVVEPQRPVLSTKTFMQHCLNCPARSHLAT